jgi:predicted TIM-barrel fold metal-dependent hydrolase
VAFDTRLITVLKRLKEVNDQLRWIKHTGAKDDKETEKEEWSRHMRELSFVYSVPISALDTALLAAGKRSRQFV